jgi:cysteine synthase A
VGTLPTTDLDLSIGDLLGRMPTDRYPVSRYPALKELRARLGNTPMLEVPSPADEAKILAKIESGNPFGSVKDRAAYALVCDAITRHGDREQPLRLLDFSGGNMARALGGVGRLTGIPIRLAMPAGTPPSLLSRLTEDGVQLDLVNTDEFLYGIIRRASAIAAEDPGWTLLHQHRNVMNVAMHQFATGAEILTQLGGRRPTFWVAAIGTGGTLTGVGRALRGHFPDVSIVGVSPAEMPYGTSQPPNGCPKFAGSGGFGYGLRQPFVTALVQEPAERTVDYPRALAAMLEFRQLTGLRIGASSAANWLIAREIAATLPPNQTVVTLFADAGTAEDWARAEALRD